MNEPRKPSITLFYVPSTSPAATDQQREDDVQRLCFRTYNSEGYTDFTEVRDFRDDPERCECELSDIAQTIELAYAMGVRDAGGDPDAAVKLLREHNARALAGFEVSEADDFELVQDPEGAPAP